MLNFHPIKFLYETRAPYVAQRAAAPIAQRIVDALDAPGGKLILLVGHDTNIAALGGFMDMHWTAADYPRDDPPPGGALAFELLTDATGAKFVKAFYQAQSMDQLRNLTPLTLASPPAQSYLPITGCTTSGDTPCPLAKFQALIRTKLEHPAAN
jgi:4-phytase/acid phosphatase